MVGIPLLDNRDLLISNASGFGESSALGDGSADSSVGTVGERNRLPLFGDDSGEGFVASSPIRFLLLLTPNQRSQMAMAATTTPTTTPMMIEVSLVEFEDDVPPLVAAVGAAVVVDGLLPVGISELE
ncbi:MAG: hypothetical protein Q9178_007365 [Gyalolechia marmorata]